MATAVRFDESYNITEYEVDPTWKSYVPEGYDDYRKRWEMASRGFVFKFPLCVEIESSYYCNLRCPICTRQTLGTFNESGFFDRKLFSKLLDEAKRHKMPAIMLDHEAEPLTNPNVADMAGEAKEAGILDIWLHTNANLMTEELSGKLIRSGLTKINFSIDASCGETYDKVRPGGNFGRVVKNVMTFLKLKEELVKRYLRTRVSFIVQDVNRHERGVFFDFWKDKVNLISFQTLIDFNKFKARTYSAGDYRADFRCYRISQLLIVRHNGDVVPCGMPLKPYDPKDFLLGNLNNSTIEECWNSPVLRRIGELHGRGEYHKLPFCRDCVSSYTERD